MTLRNMAYGPRLRPKTSRTLRRLAWAMDLPMSTTMEDLMKIMPYLINPKIICVSCQDRSQCSECYFKPRSKPALPKSRLTELLQKYFSTVPEKKLTLNKRYL